MVLTHVIGPIIVQLFIDPKAVPLYYSASIINKLNISFVQCSPAMFKRTSQLPHSLIGLVRYAGSPSLALCTTIYSVIFATQGYLSKRVQPLFYASFVLLCTERLSQEHYSCESDSHRNTIPRWQVLNSCAILEYSEAREAQSKYNI